MVEVGSQVDFAEIGGKRFAICRVASGNRTANARLRNGTIIVSIPSRWPKAEKERVSSNLLRRAIKAIEDGRWAEEQGRKVLFSHGQKLIALGRPLDVIFISSKRFGSRVDESHIVVNIVENHPRKEEIASKLARKRIVDSSMPHLLERVRALNDSHFGAKIPKVTIRDNTSRWGSCAADGSISLNFRLLFMPPDILGYVIVHELAHTKYRSHGPRFWALVEKIVPDHKEKRRWLRDNGWNVPDGNPDPGTMTRPNGQLSLEEFSDEPY